MTFWLLLKKILRIFFYLQKDFHMLLGDSTAATAILDRLLHHSCVLTINGDSYRLMSARKEKLLEENDK